MPCILKKRKRLFIANINQNCSSFLPKAFSHFPLRQFVTNQKGITLVASVILIVFVSIAVLGVTTFIIQRLSQNETKSDLARSLYLAQAGIHRAIYDFRFRDIGAPNGYFTLGQVNLDPNNFFILSASDADLLMVNNSATVIGGVNNRFLNGLTLQNATNTRPITIDRMLVSWNNARQLNRIRIRRSGAAGWTNVWPGGGSLASPANVDITNYTLNTIPWTYDVELRFDGNMTTVPTIPPGSPLTINIQFTMTDLSNKALRVYFAGALLSNFNFTVNAEGRVTGSSLRRTIRMEYNVFTSRVISYVENP